MMICWFPLITLSFEVNLFYQLKHSHPSETNSFNRVNVATSLARSSQRVKHGFTSTPDHSGPLSTPQGRATNNQHKGCTPPNAVSKQSRQRRCSGRCSRASGSGRPCRVRTSAPPSQSLPAAAKAAPVSTLARPRWPPRDLRLICRRRVGKRRRVVAALSSRDEKQSRPSRARKSYTAGAARSWDGQVLSTYGRDVLYIEIQQMSCTNTSTKCLIVVSI